MEDQKISSKYPALSAVSNKIAPSLIGCAFGMFAASKLKKHSRNKAAMGILLAGITAVTPVTYDLIRAAVNSPKLNTGRKKIINGIRNSGQPFYENFKEEEYLLEN